MRIENFPDKAATLAAIPELCAVWNEAMGPDWPLTSRLLGQCVGDDPLFEPEGLFIAREGETIIGWLLSKTNRAGGPEIGRFAGRGGIGGWCVIPARQRQGVGTALLEHAEAFLRATRVAPNTLYFPHHLLPGVPAHCEAAQKLLLARGYTKGGTHFDLQRELAGWQIPPRAHAAIEANSMVELRRALPQEQEAVCDFVTREFPGPWAYTTRGHFARGGAAGDIVVAVEADEIIGFCHTADFGSNRLLPSTYWFPLLGEKFGGFGPIGIAREHRKRGLGLALCAVAVECARERGVAAMGIDWTTLVDFYGQLGFIPWKQYFSFDAPL